MTITTTSIFNPTRCWDARAPSIPHSAIRIPHLMGLLLLAFMLPAAAVPAASTRRAARTTSATLAQNSAQLIAPGDTLAVSYVIGAADPDTTYTLDAGDEVYLNFRYSPELSQIYIRQTDQQDQREEKWSDKVSILSRAYVVQPDGTLALSGLRKPLKVAGLSTAQVAARIEALYRESGLLSRPDLNVTVNPKYQRYEPLRRSVQSASERPLLILPVPADGRISVPLVSDAQAAGKTVKAVGEELTARYRALRLPLVTVSVWFHRLGAGGRGSVCVMGEVKASGIYPLSGSLDLWSAIALAGGFTEWADVNAVRVTGPKAQGPFHFDEYLTVADPKENATLGGGELIFVPRKK